MFANTLSPQQMAVGVKSGMQKMYTAIDIHVKQPVHRHHVVGEIDISNAYQEIERAPMLVSILNHPSWSVLYPVVWATISPACTINGLRGCTSDNE